MNSAIEQGKAALRTANAQLGARLDPVSLVLLGSGLTIAVAGARAALDPDSGFKSWLFRAFLRLAKATPGAGAAIEREQEKTVQSLRKMLRIEGDNNRHLVIPPVGIERTKVLEILASFQKTESPLWAAGGASGAVYHGGQAHADFVNEAYSMFSFTNPLHTDLFKSLRKMESEVVSMAGNLVNGPDTCGAMTSGGTESILMAIKAYRDQARRERNITKPNIVISCTAHAAFIKAGDFFLVNVRRVTSNHDGTANVAAMRRAMDGNTIAIVGSAPHFPSGIIDPIEELAALAVEKGVGMHVDGCLGGFFLPFMRAAGHAVPPFDFAVPGVTSMSLDTHKYAFASKGSSVVLFRSNELRRYMYSFCLDWSGGIYATPTTAGSRPGGVIAATWAALVSIGHAGYVEIVDSIVKAREAIVRETRSIPGLEIVGNPQAMVIAYRTDGSFSIYDVLDHMSSAGYSLNGLQHPSAIHLCLTKLHTTKEFQDRFAADLRRAVEKAKIEGGKEGGMAPIYGQAASVPDPSLLEGAVGAYLDATLDATI